MRILLVFLCVLMLPSVLPVTAALDLPDDPRQSIGYWKEHTIDAEQDERVALAQRVFARLLRAWDSSRVEPGLYVVDTRTSAWAASLADGNILLSRHAIDISLAFGLQRGEHLLAFVLAHELAHQRSDDLWHQRFFRSLRQQNQAEKARLLDGLPLDAGLIADIEQMEAQADRDGLVMMASVGFDPWQILERQDFFTSWVESIWRLTCDQSGSQDFVDACEQARTRALRARVQLNSVAGQAAIYELGIQALVARNYSQARHYFTLYGREYPARAVMSAIGTSYLAEAMEIRQRILAIDATSAPAFYYPLMLDAETNLRAAGAEGKRAASAIEVESLQAQLKQRVEMAVEFLERAIRLDPDHRPLYLSIAMAHLIEGNRYRVSGVLQGRYIPKFGNDAAASMLLALNRVLADDAEGAAEALTNLRDDETAISLQTVMAPDLLRYATVFNLAELYRRLGRSNRIEALWQQLALQAQTEGRAYLFRLALQRIGKQAGPSLSRLNIAPTVKGVRLGDRKPRDDSPHLVSELWIEGELFHVYVYRDGARYISAADGKIVSASQVGGASALGDLVRVGQSADRPLKALGMPDRRLQLATGEYIAYDRYGLALKLDHDRVQGWFLYP